MNLNTFLLIDGSLMLVGLPLIDNFKGKKLIENNHDFNHIQIQLLILYPYKGVPQTVHIYQSDSLPDQLEHDCSRHEQMSTKSTLKEDHKSEIEERSEEELLEEEIRNQQTLDSFVESDKNWS